MRIARIKKETVKEEDKKVDLSLMDSFIEKYKNTRGNMIPLLQHTQELYGFIPRDAFLKLEKLSVTFTSWRHSQSLKTIV